tara:strand:- start:292 stop:1425 length:1134 start_codon:yes stop_codon:yes gene_type:complete
MTIYKKLNADQTQQKTILHEQIPITGSIVAGTYGTFPSESNVRYYTSGDYILVADYPIASSSANNLFTIAVGQSDDVNANAKAISQLAKKQNIYRLYAQQFVGYDLDQEHVPFNVSGVLNPASLFRGPYTTFGPRYPDAIFFDFDRVIAKDGIQKGTFQLQIGTGSFAGPFTALASGENVIKTFSDAYVNPEDPATYRSNSPMGDYAFLQQGTGTTVPSNSDVGFIFYDAGLVVIPCTTKMFGEELLSSSISPTKDGAGGGTAMSPEPALLSASINNITAGVRAHINNIQFNNNVELNSTYYFCRANHGEFNFSSNPSFTSGSKMVVKNNANDPSVAYITSVGLYDDENQLLAVAKLNTPLQKDPNQEITLRVRLDY